MYRRRRSGATDYRARRRAIVSKSTLLAVRVSGKNVTAQFLRPTVHGDEVLASAHSHSLRKLGWKGPLKSLPACYLLGLWAGKVAIKDGIESANLYNGLTPFVKGSRIAAFLKGVVDAGVKVPHSKEVLPSDDRIKGENIASYAAELSKDSEVYQKRFSGMLKQGFKPEEYAQNYAHTKEAIMAAEVKN
jgi:large subunit ribosomal protein L18